MRVGLRSGYSLLRSQRADVVEVGLPARICTYRSRCRLAMSTWSSAPTPPVSEGACALSVYSSNF
jgi:hypothetical protein